MVQPQENSQLLFTPTKIGSLTLPNRLIRSATAEYLAVDGIPQAGLAPLYRQLAQGGAGLIISGHMYIHPSGKANPYMTGIDRDELIPHLAALVEAVHQEGGLIAAQINHGGGAAGESSEVWVPSLITSPYLARPAKEITEKEISWLVDAFAQAARRAKTAGFDAVQIHAAHGYLNNQFLSPFTNRRTDEWGGSPEKRMHFLRAVCQAVRAQVGKDYPLFIKLASMEGVDGLTPELSLDVIAELEGMGLNALEISGGIGGDNRFFSIRKGIVKGKTEAYFRPIAHQARQRTTLPIVLVGGIRSRAQMEDILASRDADFISLSRPFIHEPDLPNRLASGVQDASTCLGANNCWPVNTGDAIACKCPPVKSR